MQQFHVPIWAAAIIVDQQKLGGNSRSTVATVTHTAQMLRMLFPRLGEPRLPARGCYSYNDPEAYARNAKA